VSFKRLGKGLGLAVGLSMLSTAGAYAQGEGPELVIAAPTGQVGTLDPHKAVQNADTAPISWMFNALVRFKPGQTNPATIEPDLAESWTVSEDGTEWTFNVRRGVKCHGNGEEFTAEDAAWSIKRASNKETSTFAGDYVDFQDAVAVDSHTLKVTLKKPLVSMPGLLANYHGGFMLCRSTAEALGGDFASKPLGTGPFVFAEHQPQRFLRLTANKDYFRGAPQVGQIIYRYMPSEASRDLAFRSGEADIQAGRNTDDWVERAEKLPNAKVVALEPAQLIQIYLNVTRPPLDDIRVRQAIQYAVDRDQLVSFVGKRVSRPAVSVIPSDNQGVAKFEFPKHDPEKARQLLAEAGYPNGLTIKMVQSNVASNLRPMEVLQQQLAQVGINMDMEVVDHTTWHTKIRQDLSDITFYAASRFPVADFYLTQFFHSASIVGKPTAVTNFSHCDVADADIEAARSEQDVQARDTFWHDAQRKLIDNVCAIPLYELTNAVVWSDKVDLGYDMVGSFTLLPDITEKVRANK